MLLSVIDTVHTLPACGRGDGLCTKADGLTGLLDLVGAKYER
jgi:hypothetical protein